MDQAAAREDAPIKIRPAAAAALLALTLFGFFVYPGHTFLQSDTLIYVPMFERMMDSSALERDLLSQRNHVSFTIYDESAILLRRVTGADFARILGAFQIAFRFAGLLGFFWIGVSLGFGETGALLMAALAGLGTVVFGPAVLTIEYEPVPRGFAMLLVYLALGLVLTRRFHASAAALAGAILWHAPAAIPLLILFVPLAMRARRAKALWWIAAGFAAVACLAASQIGLRESQPFFHKLEPDWELWQRFRAGYNWVSSWRSYYWRDVALMSGIVAAATWRLWPAMRTEHRVLFPGLAAIGLASIGVSWFTMEQLKWSLMAQVQPARASLFLNLLAILIPAACALDASRRGRRMETLLWSWIACLIPVRRLITGPFRAEDFVTIAVLGALAALIAWVAVKGHPATLAMPVAWVPFAAWMLLAYAKADGVGTLHHPELNDLARWAASGTPKSAMFQFVGFGQRAEPAVFRALAKWRSIRIGSPADK